MPADAHTCDYCGERHARVELCGKRPSLAVGRRFFVQSLAAATVGLVIAERVELAPSRRRIPLTDIPDGVGAVLSLPDDPRRRVFVFNPAKMSLVLPYARVVDYDPRTNMLTIEQRVRYIQPELVGHISG